ncbi:GTP-binding protein [Candidatus Micrarchaeota archaeon]|nr:GTP-binding protein [Candidatus Micrarchaeota archaeon]MBD3417775.1 GTP-binding protein [Candidatus Micrarchaeota archaeon]
MGSEDRIKEITEELAKTKRHKGTEHHIGLLLARRAKLQREVLEKASKKGGGKGYDIKKQGDATVVIVGFPSAGKSTLISRITDAKSKIGAYEFTTLECVPGIMKYRGAQIQVLDIPGIIAGAQEGKGRGREVLSVARKADLILIMLDATKRGQYGVIERELENVGIRMGARPPDVDIKREVKGGIHIITARKLTRISKQEIIAILNEYGVHNATITIKENISGEQLIDALERNRVYVEKVVVVNKTDLSRGIPEGFPEGAIAIAADSGKGLEELRDEIYRKLRFIRVYTKTRTKGIDKEEPMMLKEGDSIAEFLKKLPRDYRKNFRYALVWGKSVKFPGQRVGLEHVLRNEDVVYVVKK